MSLFSKKPSPEPVVKYSAVEQGLPPPPPKPDMEALINQVLANQAVIAGNQQAILSAIEGVGQLIIQYASVPAEEEVEEEEEEAPVPVTKIVKKIGRPAKGGK